MLNGHLRLGAPMQMLPSAIPLQVLPFQPLQTGRTCVKRLLCAKLVCRHSTASVLLGWATGKDLRYEQLPVEVQQHPQYGRCLIAVQDIAADEVLLSVPTDRVFASQVGARPRT